MKVVNTKKKAIFLTVLISYVFFMTGCPAVAPVTISQIAASVRLVTSLLQLAKELSNDTSKSVNVAYVSLNTSLRSPNQLSAENIQSMETTLSSLNEKAGKLRNTLGQTESQASSLFSLLKRRTNQNKTQDLKDQMLAEIQEKETEFNKKLETAKEVLKKLDISIQKYDDILGYCQVMEGGKTLDKYSAEITSVINQANELNKEIEVAINGQIQIMGTLARNADTQQ